MNGDQVYEEVNNNAKTFENVKVLVGTFDGMYKNLVFQNLWDE